MSGRGVAAGDPATVTARDAVREQVRAAVVAALVDERAAVLTFARRHAAQVRELVKLGRVPADEATLLTDRVNAFADGVAQGLHVDGDERDVRAAMRGVGGSGRMVEIALLLLAAWLAGGVAFIARSRPCGWRADALLMLLWPIHVILWLRGRDGGA